MNSEAVFSKLSSPDFCIKSARLDSAQNQLLGHALGEGASAALIEKGENNFDIYTPVITNFKGEKNYPERAEDHDWHADAGPLLFSDQASMPGKPLLSAMTDSLERVLERNHLSFDQIEYLLINQANKSLSWALADKIHFRGDKLFSRFDEFGDLAQASIGANMAILNAQEKLTGK